MPTESVRIRLAEGLFALLKRKTLKHISVRDITTECGLTRQVFYRYFHTRDDLLRWISGQDFAAVFQDLKHVAWEEMIDRMTLALQAHREFYYRLTRCADDNTLYRIMRDYTEGLYRRVILFRTGKAPEPFTDFLLRLYTSGGIEMSIEWVRSGMEKPPLDLRSWLLAGMPEPLREQLTGFSFPASLIYDPELLGGEPPRATGKLLGAEG